MDAINFESIIVGAVAAGFTAAIIGVATLPLQAYLSVEDAGAAGMRYRVDGTDPTAAEGHLLYDGDDLTVAGRADLERFRAIRAGAGNVTIRVTYFA